MYSGLVEGERNMDVNYLGKLLVEELDLNCSFVTKIIGYCSYYCLCQRWRPVPSADQSCM